MGLSPRIQKKRKRYKLSSEFRYHQLTPWPNGSPSDSRSEGCVFESRQGQLTFYAIVLITISIEKNVKAVLKIMKQLAKINEKCCCVESFCHSPLDTLAVLINIKGVGGGGVEEVSGEDLCVSMT